MKDKSMPGISIPKTLLFGFAATFFGLISSTSLEAAVRSQTLFSKGHWQVVFSYDTEDLAKFCSAQTWSGNQAFSLVAFDDLSFMIQVYDEGWNLAYRNIDFRVQVDNRTDWTMSGNGDETSVYIFPDDPDKLINFLGEIMAGNAVRVRNSRGSVVAQFSLSGSYASTLQLMDCMKMIGWGLSSSDPFGQSGDPFR